MSVPPGSCFTQPLKVSMFPRTPSFSSKLKFQYWMETRLVSSEYGQEKLGFPCFFHPGVHKKLDSVTVPHVLLLRWGKRYTRYKRQGPHGQSTWLEALEIKIPFFFTHKLPARHQVSHFIFCSHTSTSAKVG